MGKFKPRAMLKRVAQYNYKSKAAIDVVVIHYCLKTPHLTTKTRSGLGTHEEKRRKKKRKKKTKTKKRDRVRERGREKNRKKKKKYKKRKRKNKRKRKRKIRKSWKGLTPSFV